MPPVPSAGMSAEMLDDSGRAGFATSLHRSGYFLVLDAKICVLELAKEIFRKKS